MRSDIAFGANSDFLPVEKGGDWILLTAYLGDSSEIFQMLKIS